MFKQTDKDLHLFSLIYGPYGTGKTTLAHSHPGPQVVLEVEHGSMHLEKPTTSWEPGKPLPKASRDPEVSTLAIIRSWKSYRWFMDQIFYDLELPFRSVSIDTWSQVQYVLSAKVRGSFSMDELDKLPARNYDFWDKLKTAMERDIEQLNHLRFRTKRRMNVCITSAAELDHEPIRPLIKGGGQKTLPALFDLFGYLEIERLFDIDSGEEGAEVERRRLDIAPHTASVAEVKNRLPVLTREYGSYIYDPNMSVIIQLAVENHRKFTR